MECYKQDGATHLQKYTQTDIQRNHTQETQLHTQNMSHIFLRNTGIFVFAFLNKYSAHNGITVATILNYIIKHNATFSEYQILVYSRIKH